MVQMIEGKNFEEVIAVACVIVAEVNPAIAEELFAGPSASASLDGPCFREAEMAYSASQWIYFEMEVQRLEFHGVNARADI